MRSNKKILLALLIVIIIIGSFIVFLMRQPMIPLTANDSFKYYQKYLVRTFGNKDDIKVEYQHIGNHNQVTITNTSDDFWCGEITFYKADGEPLWFDMIINLGPKDVKAYLINVDSDIDYHKLKKNKFYKFTYPKEDMIAYASIDSDASNQYVWRNVILDKDHLNEETCLAIGKYYYVYDVLSGKDSPSIYIYLDSDIEYEEKDGISFPKTDSSKFIVVYDKATKTIKVVDAIVHYEILIEEKME